MMSRGLVCVAFLVAAASADPVADLITTYINFGAIPGGTPDCDKWAALFSSGVTTLSPIGNGPTGLEDMTDPMSVCKKMATEHPTMNSIISGSYIMEPYSATFYRVAFAWKLNGEVDAISKLNLEAGGGAGYKIAKPFNSDAGSAGAEDYFGGSTNVPQDLITKYMNFGAMPGGAPDCAAWAALFSSGVTTLSPIGTGPTGVTDMTDPMAVCKKIATANPTMNSIIHGSCITVFYSATYYRAAFAWKLNGKTDAISTLNFETDGAGYKIGHPFNSDAGSAGAEDYFASSPCDSAASAELMV